MNLAIYLVAGPEGFTPGAFLERVEAALSGGVDVLQYRPKRLPLREALALGLEVRALARRSGVPLVVDDRLDLALALAADGLHLGQEDLPAPLARAHWRGLLGVSARSSKEARDALEAGADYLGAGAVYPTSTKPEAEVIGLEGLRKVVESAGLPVVAIGGITPERVPEVRQAGVAGVAVVSAVMGAPNPARAARELRYAWEKTLEGKRTV